MRRIIFLLHHYDWGGAERQAFVLAKALKKKYGYVVAFSALGVANKTYTQSLEAENIPYTVIPPPDFSRSIKGYVSVIKFIWALRTLKPAIVLSYINFPNFLNGCYWQYTGAKAAIWNQRDEGFTLEGSAFERKAAARVSFFISNNIKGAQKIKQLYNITSEKISVINNGVELPDLTQVHSICTQMRNQLGIGANTFVACMTANLTVYKDHLTLLKAWQKISQNKDCLLLLVGKPGNNAVAVNEFIGQHNLQSKVRLLGYVQNVNEILAASDIGVFSSISEGNPNAVMEQMAMALPVVCSNIEGVKNLFDEVNSPLLFAPQNADDLCEKIEALYADRKLIEKIGKHNRKIIEEKFSVDVLAEKTQNVLMRFL